MDMTEQSEHSDLMEKAGELYRAWFEYGISPDDRIPSKGQVRKAIFRARDKAMSFCAFQAEMLPARVVYRRLVLLDEMTVRMVFNAMDRESRDNLMAEAKASVEKHGGKLEAHKAKLIHELYGIPRF